MRSTVFSVATLDEDQARQIAEAYIRGQKEPTRMAQLLDVESFDLNLLMHPLVRRFIVDFQRLIREDYNLATHIQKLKEIRDAAMDDENFKIALASETQIGKAAGLYDPKPFGDDPPDAAIDPKKFSTDQLRARLAHVIGATIPAPQDHALSGSEDFDDEIDSDEI